MEIELVKKKLKYQQAALDTAFTIEEGGESIVPDSMPDILRIVGVSGGVSVSDKRAVKDKIYVAGMVRTSVLYVPESGEGIFAVPVIIPFEQSFDAKGVTPDSKLLVRAKLKRLDPRMVNPRKMAVRTTISFSCMAYELAETEVTCDIHAEKAAGMQVLKTQKGFFIASGVREKAFTITDDLELSSGKPKFGEVLKAEASIITGEYRAISNKVITKGTAVVSLLYRSGDAKGEAVPASFELPFSQIIDMDGVEEGSECSVAFEVTGLELESDNAAGGGGSVGAVITVEAQVTAYSRQELALVADAYSTALDLKLDFAPVTVVAMGEHFTRRAQVKESVEAGAAVKEVLATDIRLFPPELSHTDGGVSLICEADIDMLYSAEEGGLYSAGRRITVTCPLEGAAPDKARITAAAQNESYTLNASGGIDLRFGVEFTVETVAEQKLISPSKITVTGEKAAPGGERPAMTIRRADGGESYWQVAKKYNTTADDILAANGIEDAGAAGENIPAGKLLLIPRR